MNATATTQIPQELLDSVQKRYNRNLNDLLESKSITVNNMRASIHLAPRLFTYTVEAPILIKNMRIKITTSRFYHQNIEHNGVNFEILGLNFLDDLQISHNSRFSTILDDLLEAITSVELVTTEE